MTIGFTGTRSGMSDHQRKTVAELLTRTLKKYKEAIALHGGCIGADIDFHNLCLERYDFVIEVYPGHSAKNPTDMSHRGDFPEADIIHESQTHFKRNRDIVDRCDVLIATPYNDNQQGGTWYTINYAKKKGKQILIIKR